MSTLHLIWYSDLVIVLVVVGVEVGPSSPVSGDSDSLTFMWGSVSLNPPQTVGLRRKLGLLRSQNQLLPQEPNCEAMVVRLQEVRHAA